jgi:hypothetical protein
MSTITRHSDSCLVEQVASKRQVEAVVQNFSENELLHVIINKSVKISMKWNGKCYEGRAAGMDFTSAGPSVSKTQTSIRG